VVPEILFPPEEFSITVDQFQPVTFTCSAAGIPAPDISWIRLTSEGNVSLEDSGTITIDDPVEMPNYMLSENRGVAFMVNRSLMFNCRRPIPVKSKMARDPGFCKSHWEIRSGGSRGYSYTL